MTYYIGDASIGAVMLFIARGPLGRNARCPCGSGHKFKNCCSRRVLLASTTELRP